MRRTAKFGYTVESTGVQIVEIEAALIVGLYSEYLDGKLSTCKLAKKLNEQEIKYYENGNEWNTKAVSRVLKDKSYTGEGDYPQIVDENTYQRVQDLLASRAHHIAEGEGPYAEVFKAKMRCPVCGSPIKRNAWQKGNNEKIIMRCSNKECEGFKVLTKQMDIEEYIKSIFVRAIEDEGILEPPTPEPTDISRDKEMIKMTNELRFKMQNQDITETDIIKGINEIASERFSACSSSDNTERTKLIKEKIIGSKGQSRIKAETIGEVVQRILLAPDQTVVVRLQNGMEFTERIV